MRILKLKNYISELEKEGLLVCHNVSSVDLEKDILCLTYDTRDLTDSALFIAKGAHFKEEYLDYAMSNHAIAFVSETKYEKENGIFVSDVRKAMPVLAKLFFNDAPSKITSVGITGTKGKSTVAYYIRAILNEFLRDNDKKDCAIISSIDTYDGVVNMESHITTPESVEFYRHFHNAYTSGLTHLVSEVSSQALKYGRTSGVTFDIGVFTNIGTDHISPVEHVDFEDYFTSKLKLFDCCKTAVINSESDHFDRIYQSAKNKCNIVSYGSNENDTVFCKKIQKRDDAFFFTVKTPDYEKEMCITMPGIFNVSNALAAISVAYSLGIPEKYVTQGLQNARVSGRMQLYKSSDEKIVVIVDYAHNKMSFNALYNTVNVEYPGYDIISVFGCPGKKAHLRRKDLAEEADKNSDYIIITEEDSGEESFESISSDIASNIKNCKYFTIEDRGQAIKKAILEIDAPKKIILITGKGEETRQKRGLEYIDCPTDVEYTLEYLNEYEKAPLLTN